MDHFLCVITYIFLYFQKVRCKSTNFNGPVFICYRCSSMAGGFSPDSRCRTIDCCTICGSYVTKLRNREIPMASLCLEHSNGQNEIRAKCFICSSVVHIIAMQRSPIPTPALGNLCYQCGAGRMENVCAMPVSVTAVEPV